MGRKLTKRVVKSDEEWRKTLTKEQYDVCRNHGTERPFSGKYTKFNEKGVYCCICCGEPLFQSNTKFDAGCGWPSFTSPMDGDQISERKDTSHGMIRTEVLCSACDAHLGHVFNDGPVPSRLRYCINSVALDFKKDNNN